MFKSKKLLFVIIQAINTLIVLAVILSYIITQQNLWIHVLCATSALLNGFLADTLKDLIQDLENHGNY